MSDKILTAKVAPVQIGHIVIEGLKAEDGNFYVGVPQAVDLKLVPANRSQKQLEALVGIVFSSHRKLKTELNSKAINAISLKEFELMLAKLDRKGVKPAQDMRDDLAGMSLYQLFADAHDEQVTKEDRQNFLKARQEGIRVRRTLTDAIDDYCKLHNKRDEMPLLIAICTNILYQHILGCTAADAKIALNSKKLRDALSAQQIKEIDMVEDVSVRLIYEGYEPKMAVMNSIASTRAKKLHLALN